MRSRLCTVESALQFILAGKATFTLVSEKTGTRFTYKVTKAEASDRYPGETWFVALLNGADNEANYVYLGNIKRTGQRCTYIHKSYTVGEVATSSIAASWFFGRLFSGMLSGVEVWQEGRCGRCGRKLTVPESLATGFGPECVTLVEQLPPSQQSLRFT